MNRIDIDEFLEQLKNQTICTHMYYCDLYDEFKNNPYYEQWYGIYYESELINEEGEGEDEKEGEGEVSNRYIKALKDRYYNRKKDLNCKYVYMYEVYEMLDNLQLDDEFCIVEVEAILEDLNNEIEQNKIYNLNLEKTKELIKDLKKLIYDYIIYIDSDYSYLSEATDFKNYIIKKYFKSKEEEYGRNIKRKFKKRNKKNNKEDLLKLLDSDPYKNGQLTKKEIAKKLGVSPAAVTQFCKRNKIT